MDEDFDIPAVDEMNEYFEFAGAEGNPILKVGEENEIGKQGLKKKLLKEVYGTPDVGNEVYVHYTGTLLDCTNLILADIAFTFKLGQEVAAPAKQTAAKNGNVKKAAMPYLFILCKN